MQSNVNAEKVFKSLIEDFGAEKVKMLDNNIVKLKIVYLGYMDYDNIAKLNPITSVEAKRSDKGIIFLFTPKIEPCSEPKFTLNTVRDYYELMLPQEARMAAFDNTSKSKLDLPTSNIAQAILQSFYIGDSPQGANYWQDIIWSHMYWDKD